MMPTPVKVFIFALVLLCAPLVWADDAQDFQRATQACEVGDYKPVFPTFGRFAEQGDAGAQFNLGLKYNDGHGVDGTIPLNL